MDLSLRRRLALALGAALAALLAAASGALAQTPPILAWVDCGAGLQCATLAVPRDHAAPAEGTLDLALARRPATDPARRLGSLFVNFGGPGAPGVETLRAAGPELFASLNDRFDIVAFDPRGVGESRPAIDCAVDQERDGVWAQPFATPYGPAPDAVLARAQRYVQDCLERNGEVLPFVSTANVARDLDLLRQAVGDERLSYLGFSYGTFLGATYASLFPGRSRALVLDGALDADTYVNRPFESLREQSAGFERALGRFFEACAADRETCPFGGEDVSGAFDRLVARANAAPIPVAGQAARPVDGDDLLVAAVQATYARELWPLLGTALSRAETGDGTLARLLADLFYGRRPDGTYDPLADRYFAISAVEQAYPNDPAAFFAAGRHSWALFDHAWWNSGYGELPWGLWPVEPRGVFRGDFATSPEDPATLVVGTRYDPATPYRGAIRLTTDLGNARLLTFDGDGHTAYARGSACIDAAVDAYLEEDTLPAEGTVCRQPTGFPPAPARGARAAARDIVTLRPHVRPVLR